MSDIGQAFGSRLRRHVTISEYETQDQPGREMQRAEAAEAASGVKDKEPDDAEDMSIGKNFKAGRLLPRDKWKKREIGPNEQPVRGGVPMTGRRG